MKNIADLLEFQSLCDSVGVTPPMAVTRADHLLDVAKASTAAPKGYLLSLSDEEVAPRIEALAIRRHATRDTGRGGPVDVGLVAGLETFTTDLLDEVRAAVRADVERLVAEARLGFEEAAHPFHVAAQEFGWTSTTTLDEVIDRADEAAASAWRALPAAIDRMDDYLYFRTRLSEILNLSPTEREIRRFRLADARSRDRTVGINHSICFAADDNWSLDDGYLIASQHAGFANVIDWLALAARGLRLNSPADVEAKLDARYRTRVAELMTTAREG